MIDLKNGVLYASEWIQTNTPGEYEFNNAFFNNQNDFEGLGANIINTNFVLFIPVTDVNSGALKPGVFSRYKFKSVVHNSPSTISGVISFDEDGNEAGTPSNGQFCLVSELTPNLKLAYPPIDTFYSDLISGGTVSALINNLVNVIDKLSVATQNNKIPYRVKAADWVGDKLYFPANLLPLSIYSVLEVNGVNYRYGQDNDFVYSPDGAYLIWLNSYPLSLNDNIYIV